MHGFGLEPLTFEGEPDRGVAVAPVCECPRPGRCHAVVVDEAGPLERLERLGPCARCRTAAGQAGVEPLSGQVSVAESARGDTERVRPAQLTPECARGLPVERPPDPKVRPHDRVRGNEAPGRAVELDLDAPARPLPQRGDDRSDG